MKLYRTKNAKFGENFSTEELRDHYEALIDDSGKAKSLSREQLLKALKGTEFEEHAYNAKKNDLDPKDRATLKQLKDALQKASDEMDDHPGAAKYEAAYKAAEKQYNDFVEKVSLGKTNANEAEVRKLAEMVIDEVLEPKWEDVVRIAKREGYEKPIPARAWGLIGMELRKLGKTNARPPTSRFEKGDDVIWRGHVYEVGSVRTTADGYQYDLYKPDGKRVTFVPEEQVSPADKTSGQIGRQNDKASPGDTVSYGPYKWKVEKVEGNRYFLRQVGGGQVAEHISERDIRKENAGELDELDLDVKKAFKAMMRNPGNVQLQREYEQLKSRQRGITPKDTRSKMDKFKKSVYGV